MGIHTLYFQLLERQSMSSIIFDYNIGDIVEFVDTYHLYHHEVLNLKRIRAIIFNEDGTWYVTDKDYNHQYKAEDLQLVRGRN